MTLEEERNRFDKIDAHNRYLIRKMAEPGFDGFTALDPTLNKAQMYIHLADEVIVTYPQGAFPQSLAWESVKSTMKLLKRSRERYGRIATKTVEQRFLSHIRLWFYIGSPMFPPELFAKKLFRSEERLINALCDYVVTLADEPRPPQQKRRGHRYGERDPQLHRERAEIVAEMRRRKVDNGRSWPKIAAEMRLNSAYSARMRGRSDATWIRYAKAGFSG